MALACPTGGMLSAIYDMEFIVSKVGGTLLVHAVRDCAVYLLDYIRTVASVRLVE